MDDMKTDPAWNPKIMPMEEYVRLAAVADLDLPEPGGGGGFWSKGPHTTLSKKVEGLAWAFDCWVIGFREPVGDEVYIWQGKYLDWLESDCPKPHTWLGRWPVREGVDPRLPTLGRLHQEMVGYLLASPHHEAPEWEDSANHASDAWRLESVVERASRVVKALLVELVAERRITITRETVVTEVDEIESRGHSHLNHHVWRLIADKLWDPGWDWSSLRLHKA